MHFPIPRLLIVVTFLLVSCTSREVPSAEIQIPVVDTDRLPTGFVEVTGSRPLSFPDDFGAHEEFRTEWWYYTGNLESTAGRHFGFELTIFRVGVVSPATELPADSLWRGRSLYFAHFAVSDIENEDFHAFERYSRPGPGLAGAQSEPYRVWIDDWSITGVAPSEYRLQAAQEGISLDLTLTDELGVIMHGKNGYSRKGEEPTNASYYYSQPRLRAEGMIQLEEEWFSVSGLAWKDHEFGSGVLDENQIGWDWFSLQFEDGSALMLFQLRERDGKIAAASSGTFIDGSGGVQAMPNTGFEVIVQDEWRSPRTQGIYPEAWEIRLDKPDCRLEVIPWMADQEIAFPAVTYWEGAVQFEGDCDGSSVRGNGYIELTGYAGNLPLP